jgi:sodium-dependent dicarboxylate transporter 2/3/5
LSTNTASIEKTKMSEIILVIVSVLFMFATRFITPPAGLSQSGLQVLGILIGAVLLWLFVNVGWSSLLALFAIMTLPEYTVETVTAGSIGNSTVFFVLLCFMISVSLTKTGLAKRIAVSFLTSKLSRKGAWYTVGMLMAAIFILSSVMSSTALMMIFIPIVYEMFTETGYAKEHNVAMPSMIMISMLIIAQIAQATTPISHTMTLVGFNTYANFAGEPMDFFTYCAICLPLGMICAVVWFLVCRFIWKPDVSKLSQVDFERLKNDVGPMTKKEKIAAFVYVIVVICWILPGVSRYLFPSLSGFFGAIHQCYPPLIAVLLLNFVKVDGEPITKYADALKGVPWGTVIFMGAIMMLGSAISNPDIGLTAWTSGVLAPLFSHVSPVAFILIMVAVVIVLTNFVSNAVAIAIVFSIAMPLAINVYGGTVDLRMLGVLLISGASYAFATPPATPPAAVVADSGWLSTRAMFKWGMVATLVCIILFYCIGYPLAAAIAA